MIHNNLLRNVLLLSFLLLTGNIAWGQIFSNPITGAHPGQSNPYTIGQTINANITVSGIGRGTGLSGANGNNSYNASDWTTSGSLDANDYFDFTLTPNSGYKINFTDFTYIGQSSAQGPTNFAFRSSVDNYATNIGTALETGTTIDLSAAAYQNVSTAITFRFYGWVAGGTSGTYSIDQFSFSGAALPVELTAFTAKASGQSTLLTFSTATESNNSHFVIERGADVRTFSGIGQVRGAGTTQEPQSYTFTDEKPLSGTNYYRLRQVDYDGTESFSQVLSVVFGKSDRIIIAPSPATDRVRILLEEAPGRETYWKVYDNMGREVLSGAWDTESAEYEIEVNALPEGMYTFRLEVGSAVQVKQFRKM